LRQTRYQDAIDWLKGVKKGESTDLPELKDENGIDLPDIRIKSKHIPESNRY